MTHLALESTHQAKQMFLSERLARQKAENARFRDMAVVAAPRQEIMIVRTLQLVSETLTFYPTTVNCPNSRISVMNVSCDLTLIIKKLNPCRGLN